MDDNFLDSDAIELEEEKAPASGKKGKGKSKNSTKNTVSAGGVVDKIRALDNALAQIEKDFGKGSIMKFGENNNSEVSVVSSGCLGLDIALGVGGLPRGRIIEIYGPEASGKTTVALHAVAEVQKAGGIAAYVDAEHALDPAYAAKLGVDINELYISQPDDGEQALEIAETLIRSGAIELVIVDSVAALVPRAEIEGEMGDSHMGLQARLMSQALRKLTAIINKTNSMIIFINQLREKIGVSFGNPETTTGGRALKFYSTIRIEIRKGEPIKGNSEIIGSRTKVKIAKNKVSPPFRTCEFDIIYGKGVSRAGDVLDLGVEEKIVNKSGSWFSYNETRLGQGRDNVRNYLTENPQLCREIENKVRLANNLPELPVIEATEDTEDTEVIEIDVAETAVAETDENEAADK